MEKIFICLFIITTVFFSSCYDEKALEAMSGDDLALFGFPQGNEAWDNEAAEIYKNFGVKLIYKAYQPVDFNRFWTASSTPFEIIAEDLNDEQVQYNMNFMKNHVFRYLEERFTREVMPPYIFMTYDAYEFASGRFENTIRTSFNGMDHWLHCMEGTPKVGSSNTLDTIKRPVTQAEYRQYRIRYLQRVFCIAILRGKIRVPEFLKSKKEGGEMDYETVLLSSLPSIASTIDLTDPTANLNTTVKAALENPNFCVNRGFSYGLPSEVFTERDKISNYNLCSVTDYKMVGFITLVNPEKAFWDHINLVMRFSVEELEQGIKGKTNWTTIPLLRSRHPNYYKYRQKTIDYMKEEYGIDLEAIYQGPDVL